LGFINQNMAILGFVIGLLVKYLPALKFVPNVLIPYLITLTGILTSLFGPVDAQAATGILGLGGGLLSVFITSGIEAIKSALIYEVFARHPLEARGIRKVQ
jgi:hypothetical protein